MEKRLVLALNIGTWIQTYHETLQCQYTYAAPVLSILTFCSNHLTNHSYSEQHKLRRIFTPFEWTRHY